MNGRCWRVSSYFTGVDSKLEDSAAAISFLALSNAPGVTVRNRMVEPRVVPVLSAPAKIKSNT
jgi:hypothetical protein